MTESWLPTLGVSLLVMIMLYRRARRLFGVQQFRRHRMVIRVAVIGTITLALAALVIPASGLATAPGLAAGMLLGLIGLGLTRFETSEGALYFRPNLYLGMAVLSLFVGRMLFRIAELGSVLGRDDPDGAVAPFESLTRSPVSGFILLLVLGYYSVYYGSVLLRGWGLEAHPAGAVADEP